MHPTVRANLPGESEQAWLNHLEGLRGSLQPANYHEEEIVRNVALGYWQLRRVSFYEAAKMHVIDAPILHAWSPSILSFRRKLHRIFVAYV
ncbi:MAG TPA: hypothetical protein VE242_06180 [Chthoniobacterales bacterium]|nr:hypothetical protein [Chthoniobacterales bacterium]